MARGSPLPRLEIFEGKNRRWYWRKVAVNGKKSSHGGEDFASKFNAKRAATRQHPGMSVVYLKKPGNRHNQDDMLP